MIHNHFLTTDAAWAPWTVRVLCSVTIVWLAAGVVAFSLRTASAAVRHRIWALSVIAALALPVLVAALPEWRTGWIDLGSSDVRARNVSRTAGRPGEAFSQGASHQEAIGENPLVGAPTRAPTRAAPIRASRTTMAENPGDSTAEMFAPRFARLGFLAFWAAPAALALVWTACSMLAARRLVRRATLIDDETCKEMLRGLHPAGGKLAAVQLRESEATVSPLCVGWRRPAIVLPCGWRDWPRGHLAAALAHELAHVVRRDVAWQFLARTACAIYWFHPLAWLAAWRMRVEREAACDDWALAAGQPPVGYARVLLDFAEQLSRRHPAPPASAVAMAGCRGFERRIRAILSRRRRRDPVGRSAGWLLAAAMLGVGLIGGIVSPLASSQAGGAPDDPAQTGKGSTVEKDDEAPKTKMVGDLLHFAGRVVDERGRGVADVLVEAIDHEPRPSTRSAADGGFELAQQKKRGGVLTLRAMSDGASRQAYYQISGAALADAELRSPEVKLVLRPAREIPIAVVDDQQQPVAGAWAAVKIYWTGIADETTTDAAGRAVLRVPADANVEYVMAAKADAGLDYFIYRRPDEPLSDPYKLPPDRREALTLTLNGVRPATVRVVDEQGRPLAGVQVAPWYFDKPNKGGYLNSGASWFQVSTDADGRAVFRTVPADLASDLTLWPHRDDFVLAERPVLRVQLPTDELTATLLPMTPVAGRVTFADGRPAAGAVVNVAGDRYQLDSFSESVRADENGRFELRVVPDQFYFFAAALDRWASPVESRVVRLGRPLADVNLVLGKATRVYGHAAMAGDGRPLVGQDVVLYLHRDDNEYIRLPEAEKLPNPKGDRKLIQPRITRHAITNERGEFEFFTGPGHYYLMGPNDVKPPKFVITDQADMELILYAQRPDRVEFAGQVVMKSAPSQMVKDVKVLGSPVGGRGGFLSAASGADGTFRVERTPSKMVLQALSADERLGAIVQIGPDESLRVIQVVPTASARGRLVDAAGKPLAKRRIDFGLQFEQFTHTFYRQAATDDRGEFELDGFVPGEEYFLDVAVDGDDKSERPQKATIKVFKPESAETVELGDVELKPSP